MYVPFSALDIECFTKAVLLKQKTVSLGVLASQQCHSLAFHIIKISRIISCKLTCFYEESVCTFRVELGS